MKRWHILIATAILMLTTACVDNIEVKEYSIIPEPVYLVQKGRTYTLSPSTKLCFENLGQNSPTAKYITTSLRQMHVRPAFIGTPKKDCITFTINDTVNPALGDEGYLLQVHPDGIFVSANTEAGIFYAFQTFVQMLPEDVATTRYSKIDLPYCHIKDYPRFEWRGCHLDVSRHFFGVSQVKKILDVIVNMKSFNKAAELCFVSTSTLTRQVTALEAEIGFPIFERSSFGVSLTPQGEIFYRQTQSIPWLYESAVNAARSTGLGKSKVRIGIFSYTRKAVAHACEILKEENANIDFSFVSCRFRDSSPARNGKPGKDRFPFGSDQSRCV